MEWTHPHFNGVTEFGASNHDFATREREIQSMAAQVARVNLRHGGLHTDLKVGLAMPLNHYVTLGRSGLRGESIVPRHDDFW